MQDNVYCNLLFIYVKDNGYKHSIQIFLPYKGGEITANSHAILPHVKIFVYSPINNC